MHRQTRAAIYRIQSAFPQTQFTQAYCKQELVRFMETHHPSSSHLNWIKQIFEHSSIDTKRMLFDPATIHKSHLHTECTMMDKAFEECLRLSQTLTLQLFENAPVTTADLHACFVGSEVQPGLHVDVFLQAYGVYTNAHMKKDVSIGKGCGGGVANLCKAMDYLRAYPTHMVQIINVDLYSRLWAYAYGNVFREFGSPKYDSNAAIKTMIRNVLVPACILADAASSALLVGEHHPLFAEGKMVLADSERVTVPDTLQHVFGTRHPYGGVPSLSLAIPQVGCLAEKEAIVRLLQREGCTLSDLQWLCLHPGGVKVLEKAQEVFGIPSSQLKHSYEVLRTYGNCSSPTVLLVLERMLHDPAIQGKGVIAAVGPGMMAEVISAHKY